MHAVIFCCWKFFVKAECLSLSLHSLLPWSVAVLTTRRHSSRSAAFCQAAWMPKFRLTSSATTRSHVELGLPWGRFQNNGGFCIAACTARRWTSVGCARATWPKKRSLLARTMSETGWHHVRDWLALCHLPDLRICHVLCVRNAEDLP